MTNKYYYKDGSVLDCRDYDKVLHRENGPAIERVNGDKEWYVNGRLHRENGPAIEYTNGDKSWYINGKLHREDGSAIEYASGSKVWYINGKRHREDGPAVEYVNGYKAWYLNDTEYSEENFKARLKAVNNMSDIELATSPEEWIRKRVKHEAR